MTTTERQLTLSSTFMSHSSGTKHYALFTLTDHERNSAVGVQVWGEVGKVSGAKFISGTAIQVRTSQDKKIAEKERTRNGEHYRITGSPSAEYSVSQAMAALKALLLNLGAATRKADEIASEALANFGVSYAQAAEAAREEVKAKTKEERKAQGADYGGMWGAW